MFTWNYKQQWYQSQETRHNNKPVILQLLYNSIGKKIQTLPRCGLVTIHISRHFFYVPLVFSVVLFAKVCVFLPVQFCKAEDCTLALLYTNIYFQYLLKYSSDFNNFCRFGLLATCIIHTAVVIRMPEIWSPNFYCPFLKFKQCLHGIISNNDTNHKKQDTTTSQ